ALLPEAGVVAAEHEVLLRRHHDIDRPHVAHVPDAAHRDQEAADLERDHLALAGLPVCVETDGEAGHQWCIPRSVTARRARLPVVPLSCWCSCANSIGDSPAAWACFVRAPGCSTAPAIQCFGCWVSL